MAETLLATPLREVAGAQTMSRYAYQAHYGLLKIFELHASGKDYRVVFDFLDDIAVLKSSTAPTKINLCQLKTKSSGKWTAKQLASRPKQGGLPRSFIGKLYYPISTIDLFVESISFVSNAPFDVALTTGKNSSTEDNLITGPLIADSEIKLFDNAIDADYPGHQRLAYRDRLFLERSSLGLNDQDTMVIGRIVKFAADQAGVDAPPANAIYGTLVAKVIALTGNTTSAFPTEAAFHERKTIGRNEIQDLIEALKSQKGFLTNWSVVESELTASGAATQTVIRTKTACIKYLKDRAAGVATAVAFSKAAATEIMASPSVKDAGMLGPIADFLSSALSSSCCAGWPPIEIRGAALVEAYEALDD